MTLRTFEKMVLMLVDTFGMMEPAATATKPAINAYSIRSWPRVSFQIRSCHTLPDSLHTLPSLKGGLFG